MYGQYNNRREGYCVPMAVERMDINVKLLFGRHSSWGQKLMERLRDSYGNETVGHKNPKIRVENKHEAKQVEEYNDFDYIINYGMMKDNHYSDMRNSGGSYGPVIRVEMM